MAETTKSLAQVLINKPADEAWRLAKEAGFKFRATIIDGDHMFGTTDYDPRRVNVAISNKVVTKIVGFG